MSNAIETFDVCYRAGKTFELRDLIPDGARSFTVMPVAGARLVLETADDSRELYLAAALSPARRAVRANPLDILRSV